MIPTRSVSIIGTVRRHLRIIAVIAAAVVPAGLLRADTILLKSDTGTSPVEGAIQSVDANEVIYTPAASDPDVTRPIDAVLQIKSPGEPELTSAEQAFADGKWADAVTLYHRTLSFSESDWAKYRAIVRLIDAAGKCQQFEAQAEAFVKLASLDPANARAHQPETRGAKKEELTAALKQANDRLANDNPETKVVLLSFLADLHSANDEPKLAIEAQDELRRLRLAAATVGLENRSGHTLGPLVPTFHKAGNARRIVFVCDPSGTMLNKMASLKDQLQRAVASLRPFQSFDIVLLRGPVTLPLIKHNSSLPTRLRSAKPTSSSTMRRSPARLTPPPA